MKKLSGFMLLALWVMGLSFMAIDMRSRMRRIRGDMPKIRANVLARREREDMRRLDSVMAFQRAPVTVTSSGETLRAVAYASSPRARPGGIPIWLRLSAALWVFKIPLLLGILTIGWIVDRIRTHGLETPPPAAT
jgi:hypothetical protein